MRFIQKIHGFFWLLPLFFVLHGVRENIGFIEWSAAILLLLSYWFYALLCWGLSFLMFKNNLSSSWMSTACMIFYLFFGAVKDFFLAIPTLAWLGKYSILIPSGVILLSYTGIRLYRKSAVSVAFQRYANTLLILLIAVECVQLSYQSFVAKKGLSIYFSTHEHPIESHCKTQQKPNIWFLLFDEYESSLSLKERFHFNNTLDTALLSEKFHINQEARSNYNFTPFSMASLLNMDYIQGIQHPESVTVEDYAKCNALIKHNRLIEFLGATGYDLQNFSIFDLAGHPSAVEQHLLPLQSKLISDRTFIAHVKKDIGWKLMKYFPFNYFFGMDYRLHHSNNQQFMKAVIATSANKKEKPLFTYAHFYMPHPPFYVDQNGMERNSLHDDIKGSPTHYLNYVLYTNQKIMEMVRALKKNDPTGVIVVMGDHGYRNSKDGQAHLFRSLNAIYFPDQQYQDFEQPTSHVNQFRLILNKLFCTEQPLLKDTQILLRDKGALP